MEGIDGQHPTDRISLSLLNTPDLSANDVCWNLNDRHDKMTKDKCIQCHHKKRCSLHAKRRIGKRISPKSACLVHRMQKKKCPGFSCPASKTVAHRPIDTLLAGSQVLPSASHENRGQEHTLVLPPSSSRALMPHNFGPFYAVREPQDRRFIEELPFCSSAPDVTQPYAEPIPAAKLLRSPTSNGIVMASSLNYLRKRQNKLRELENQIKDMKTQRDRANKTSAELRISVEALRAENNYLKDLVIIMQSAPDQDSVLLRCPPNMVVPDEIHFNSDTALPTNMSSHDVRITEKEISVFPASTISPMTIPAPTSKPMQFSIPGNIATTLSSDLCSVAFNKVPSSPAPVPEILVVKGSIHKWFEPPTPDDEHLIDMFFTSPIDSVITNTIPTTPYDIELDFSDPAPLTSPHSPLGSPSWSFSPNPLVTVAKPHIVEVAEELADGETPGEDDHAVPDVSNRMWHDQPHELGVDGKAHCELLVPRRWVRAKSGPKIFREEVSK